MCLKNRVLGITLHKALASLCQWGSLVTDYFTCKQWCDSLVMGFKSSHQLANEMVRVKSGVPLPVKY